jgi:hypothetical protein
MLGGGGGACEGWWPTVLGRTVLCITMRLPPMVFVLVVARSWSLPGCAQVVFVCAFLMSPPCVWPVVPILGPLYGIRRIVRTGELVGGSKAAVVNATIVVVVISATVASTITICATAITVAARIAAATIDTAAVAVAALLVATSSAVCGLLVYMGV